MDTHLDNTKRVVIKLGTGILTSGIGNLDTGRIAGLCEQIAKLREAGKQVLIVSSGAVGMGMGRLGLTQRPTRLPELQKCAAVGQSILTETWEQALRPHGIHVAQVLLTGNDMESPDHHRVFTEFLDEVLSSDIVPIVNENDCISTDGFRLGDNDSLAALVATRVKAELLVILSTVDGLLNTAGDNELIERIDTITPEIEALAGGAGSTTSVGGMWTKVRAARLATASGCGVFLGSGYDPAILSHLFEHKAKGTWFPPQLPTRNARRRLTHHRWRVFFGGTEGQIVVDDGASKALIENNASLLAKGVVSVKGDFEEGSVIDIVHHAHKGHKIARGRAGFDAKTMATLCGMSSEDIEKAHPDHPTEAVHRDSIVLY